MVRCWVIGAIYTIYLTHINQLVEAYFNVREARLNEETFNALVLIFRRMIMTLKTLCVLQILDGSKNQ